MLYASDIHRQRRIEPVEFDEGTNAALWEIWDHGNFKSAFVGYVATGRPGAGLSRFDCSRYETRPIDIFRREEQRELFTAFWPLWAVCLWSPRSQAQSLHWVFAESLVNDPEIPEILTRWRTLSPTSFSQCRIGFIDLKAQSEKAARAKTRQGELAL